MTAFEWRAITIQQPHVAAIFAGLKEFETRSWATKHRGPLLIHAGRNADVDGMEFAQATTLPPQLLSRGMYGVIVGMVDLVDCRQTSAVPRDVVRVGWGDFSPGRFAFKLENPRLLKAPIPVRGQLGIWRFEGVPGEFDR